MEKPDPKPETKPELRPPRVIRYCAGCRKTSFFIWEHGVLMCVGHPHENPPREGCGHKLTWR